MAKRKAKRPALDLDETQETQAERDHPVNRIVQRLGTALEKSIGEEGPNTTFNALLWIVVQVARQNAIPMGRIFAIIRQMDLEAGRIEPRATRSAVDDTRSSLASTRFASEGIERVLAPSAATELAEKP
jgi:hypothetical protein